jgi:hypothetical protein
MEVIVRLPLIVASLGLMSLAACGGGSTGVNMFTNIKTFSNGSGVVTGSATEDGLTVSTVALVPNATNYRPESGLMEPIDVDNYVYGGETEFWSNLYDSHYVVYILADGNPNSLLIYADEDAEVALVANEGSLGDLMMTAGEQVMLLPSGTYTYRGRAFVNKKSTTGYESGSFTLSANFAARTASISASTQTTSLNGQNLTINNDGSITGRNLVLTSSGSTSSSAGVDGLFHGLFAVGVSGVYYDNANNPSLHGGFAGNR